MKVGYKIGELAASQAGLLGHQQAVSLGMSDDAIHRQLKQGILLPAARGLYRLNGISGDYRGYLRAAMAILPDPTVSHESAAEVHGMKFVRKKLAVVTVHAGTTHEFPGVKIHRSIDLFPDHRSVVSGLNTTTPARTLTDLAAVLRPEQMAQVLDEELAARPGLIDKVQRVFHEVARRGRNGTGLMRSLLDERVGSSLISATKLERVGMNVFDVGGLPRPEFQYPAPWNPSRLIDFAWPFCRVGCECDSRRWHTRVNDFQNDRTRDNLALKHNWRIYRFTWEDFQFRPGMVIAQLAEALAA
ncbi:MAG: type IV toxin-antitoxin system AbiEi family antitoxin domain-containing protein [Acidimicrobiia bacterium]